MQSDSELSRRDFIEVLCLGAAGFILLGRAGFALAKDSEVPLPPGKKAVSEWDDPMAKSLGYTAYAKDVNKSKYPSYKPEQSCQSCGFYTSANKGWGSCKLFATGLVSAQGWCASWNGKK